MMEIAFDQNNDGMISEEEANFYLSGKVIHPKYYKHLKKGAHQSHFGIQKMGWFLAY